LFAGASGSAPAAGVSGGGGVTAMDGDAGVWGSGTPEALRASEIPPWAAIDKNTDSTQDRAVLIAPLLASPPART